MSWLCFCDRASGVGSSRSSVSGRQSLGWSITYEEDDGVLLAGTADACPQLFLQAVPESKTVKNRVHVDLGADDFAAELGRLVGLGAPVLNQTGDDTKQSAVLADPEGNEFCLAG